MRTRADITKEVEDRNKFRAEVDLPLVSVPEEVAKIRKWEISQAYQHWYDTHPLRPQIEAEILASERKSRGDPNWLPRYYLNGGVGFGIQMHERMKPLWEKEKEQILKW